MLLSQIASSLNKESNESFNKAFFRGKTTESDILKNTLSELGMSVKDSTKPQTQQVQSHDSQTQSVQPSQSQPSRKQRREHERLQKKIQRQDSKPDKSTEEKVDLQKKLSEVRRDVIENSEESARLRRVLGL